MNYQLAEDRCSDGTIIGTFYIDEDVPIPYYETARMRRDADDGKWYDLHIPIPSAPDRVTHELRSKTHDQAMRVHQEAYRLTQAWLAEPERH